MSDNKYYDLNQEFYISRFEKGLDYKSYMSSSAEHERPRWQTVYDRVILTDAQKELLNGFKRKMNVLCMSGSWCGDCVKQGPILQRIAEASDVIDLRFLDRDSNPDLRDRLRILGGTRVPVVVFLSEDFFECGRFGDRTLSTYRRMAAELWKSSIKFAPIPAYAGIPKLAERIGPACSTGIVPPPENELTAVTQDWVDIFERVQLMLRLSPMLRERYGD